MVFVLISGAIAAPIGVIVLVNESQKDAQAQITCTTLQAGLVEARAIAANRVLLVRIAASLGLHVRIPPPIDLPEVPAECDGL